MDSIRYKYGSNSITRGVFINSEIKGMSGGVDCYDYPIMSSIL